MPRQTTLAPKPLYFGPQGRVVIPAEYRRALGVEAGDILRRRQTVEEELWGLMAGVTGSLAEELLSERREETRRDNTS